MVHITLLNLYQLFVWLSMVISVAIQHHVLFNYTSSFILCQFFWFDTSLLIMFEPTKLVYLFLPYIAYDNIVNLYQFFVWFSTLLNIAIRRHMLFNYTSLFILCQLFVRFTISTLFIKKWYTLIYHILIYNHIISLLKL